MSELRIGCSGWIYKEWKGPFYPDDLKLKDRLAYFATQFNTAEINGSFYRLPTQKAVAGWAAGAPEGFVFSWKVSRYISHMKRLTDCEESIDLVFGRMQGLGEAEGPALVQLPPSLKRDDERLKVFLGWLPKRRPHVIEFRHPSWYDEAVFALLERHNAALCISDHHHAPAPVRATADFVYWRGHGPGGRYYGRYGEAALEALAEQIKVWRRKACDVYAYFDNDIGAAAPKDAQRLKSLLGDD
jgi:uncharacterized protein YecE (DUF72 family)